MHFVITWTLPFELKPCSGIEKVHLTHSRKLSHLTERFYSKILIIVAGSCKTFQNKRFSPFPHTPEALINLSPSDSLSLCHLSICCCSVHVLPTFMAPILITLPFYRRAKRTEPGAERAEEHSDPADAPVIRPLRETFKIPGKIHDSIKTIPILLSLAAISANFSSQLPITAHANCLLLPRSSPLKQTLRVYRNKKQKKPWKRCGLSVRVFLHDEWGWDKRAPRCDSK